MVAPLRLFSSAGLLTTGNRFPALAGRTSAPLPQVGEPFGVPIAGGAAGSAPGPGGAALGSPLWKEASHTALSSPTTGRTAWQANAEATGPGWQTYL